jgi:serine/threonine-protein kinase
MKVAPWVAATDEEARAYLQSRVSLFSILVFWATASLLGFVRGLYAIYPQTEPINVEIVHAISAIGLVTLGTIWTFGLRRRETSIAGLYRIDLAVTIVAGSILGLSMGLSPEQRAAVWIALVWQIWVVLGRSLLVPSTPRRTLVVSTLSFLPIVVAGITMAILTPEYLEIPPVPFILGDVTHVGVVILLAVTGSKVIYGLRRQVGEAMQLGRYTLGEKIGEGGMGVVYRAHHAMLRRPTAIKLLPPAKLGAESLRRFEREVQHMSQLTHPNTVAVYDYGRSPEGVFYYAMEYLDGIDLETLVKLDGPQPAPRVIHILRQVCGALDEAHGAGLTHRDIKPANVILCRRGNQPDVAKVVDFGLVKEIARETDDSRTQLILGTPAYLAPEAVTDPETVGPSADLYALGAVGYYLLTGKRVFEGKTTLDLCVQHASATPVAPSKRTDNAIPSDLEALVLACLQKSPEDRPPSARELRAALGGLRAYEEWDEASALSWWESWSEKREAAKLAASEPGRSASTMTVDMRGRDGRAA